MVTIWNVLKTLIFLFYLLYRCVFKNTAALSGDLLSGVGEPDTAGDLGTICPVKWSRTLQVIWGSFVRCWGAGHCSPISGPFVRRCGAGHCSTIRGPFVLWSGAGHNQRTFCLGKWSRTFFGVVTAAVLQGAYLGGRAKEVSYNGSVSVSSWIYNLINVGIGTGTVQEIWAGSRMFQKDGSE